MSTSSFKKIIWNYYQQHGRDLPWRKQITPYRILVSEVMLQQTQVSRGLVKYPEFIKKFPNFKSLAAAPAREVLSVWSGLGYNRRALYLKKTAEIVVEKYKGKLPTETHQLTALPGIGPNTAGAILAYAHNHPVVFIETNIRKVFIHHFFKDRKNIGDKEILPLVEKTLDRKNPREWYWALMDYGSYLAQTVENPNRKSKRYSRQTKFEGSLRQLRGKILKKLLERKDLKIENLEIEISDPRCKSALAQLQKEGFVGIAGSSVRLL